MQVSQQLRRHITYLLERELQQRENDLEHADDEVRADYEADVRWSREALAEWKRGRR